jgi:hypothetical protein
MSMLCSICRSPRRQSIDIALLLHKTGYRDIARRYGVQKDALQRHEREHLKSSFTLSKGLTAMLSADNLLARLASLDEQTLELLAEARTAGERRIALAAIRESRENISAYSRIGVESANEQRLDVLEHRADLSVQAVYDKPHDDQEQEP